MTGSREMERERERETERKFRERDTFYVNSVYKT